VGLLNFLPWLALNCYTFDLCLPSGWDYKLEPLHLALPSHFFLLFSHISVVENIKDNLYQMRKMN
jgi:hypothetical protein